MQCLASNGAAHGTFFIMHHLQLHEKNVHPNPGENAWCHAVKNLFLRYFMLQLPLSVAVQLNGENVATSDVYCPNKFDHFLCPQCAPIVCDLWGIPIQEDSSRW